MPECLGRYRVLRQSTLRSLPDSLDTVLDDVLFRPSPLPVTLAEDLPKASHTTPNPHFYFYPLHS